MCTSIHTKQKDFYFGRNLDLECRFNEKVVITPRNYEFKFKMQPAISNHYALIGMATVIEDYPLYAECANEKGLCMAGLNFPTLAHYFEVQDDKENIAPFEFIPWLLSQCANVKEAKKLLDKINLVNVPFSDKIPLSPLHWMLSDENESLIIESQKDGLHIYEDKFGILTNNPPYEYHCWNLNNYLHLSPQSPENRFSSKLDLKPYAQGMGAIGLPGDASSASRFVRAAYLLNNSLFGEDEESIVTQFFHILDALGMVKGSVLTPGALPDITTYSCCVNATKGEYYYKTYENSQVNKVSLHHENLDTKELISYELIDKQMIYQIN